MCRCKYTLTLPLLWLPSRRRAPSLAHSSMACHWARANFISCHQVEFGWLAASSGSSSLIKSWTLDWKLKKKKEKKKRCYQQPSSAATFKLLVHGPTTSSKALTLIGEYIYMGCIIIRSTLIFGDFASCNREYLGPQIGSMNNRFNRFHSTTLVIWLPFSQSYCDK